MRTVLFAIAFTTVLSGAGPPRPRITGVAHISLYAADFEKSRAFYGSFLGFAEPYSLKKPDGTPSMTFFKINERQYIELAPERAPGTDRLSHIALQTSDAEAMRLYLASKGIKVPAKVPVGRIGNANFMIRDPEGHNVEIVQYLPDSWTVKAKGKYLPDTRISNWMMHVGIIVTKFQPEMDFYEKVLGFQEIWRGSKSPDVLSWVNLKVPEGKDYIELMLYKKAPQATKRGTAHHLALTVPDIEKAVAELKSRPYDKQYGREIAVHTGVNRKRQANLYDPDGTRIELMEPATIDGKPAPSSKAPPPD
ncbi:MAG TPA: VOC family protein [Bryobacteraceae bacterium]|jgi:lactoylglutathione lyase|nr:VOC family protein [Bryobacteraceae bacterium]